MFFYLILDTQIPLKYLTTEFICCPSLSVLMKLPFVTCYCNPMDNDDELNNLHDVFKFNRLGIFEPAFTALALGACAPANNDPYEHNGRVH